MKAKERLVKLIEENYYSDNIAESILKEFMYVPETLFELGFIPLKDAGKYCEFCEYEELNTGTGCVEVFQGVKLKPEYEEEK